MLERWHGVQPREVHVWWELLCWRGRRPPRCAAVPQPRPVRPGPCPRRSPGRCVWELLWGAARRAHLRSPSLGTRPSAGAVPGDTRTRRSKDVTFGTARRGDAGRGWRDSAHVAPGSSRRRAPRPRPCVRRGGSGMRERAPGSPAKWGCAAPGVLWSRSSPRESAQTPLELRLPAAVRERGRRSPRSRFCVGSTRWTRMSNHRARLCQHGDVRGHRCQLLALRGTACSVPAAARGDPHTRLLPGGTGTSPSAEPRRQGTRRPPAALPPCGAARGAGPGAAGETSGQSRAEAGTSSPSPCPLPQGAFVLPARSEEWGGFRRRSSFGLRLSSLQMIIIVIT